MDNVLLLDAARLAHLVGLAMGLGLALCADAIALKSCFRPITALDVRLLSMIHRVIMVALGVLWASGLMLLTFRTGWDLAAFTPKLVMKLCVVVLLTLNAIVHVMAHATCSRDVPNHAQRSAHPGESPRTHRPARAPDPAALRDEFSVLPV